MEDLCGAILCGCLCAYCCAEAADASRGGVVYTNQPVIVQNVQPVMVQYQGQYVEGHYIQNPDGTVQFIPVQPGSYMASGQIQYPPHYVQDPNGQAMHPVDQLGQPLYMPQAYIANNGIQSPSIPPPNGHQQPLPPQSMQPVRAQPSLAPLKPLVPHNDTQKTVL